MEPEKLNTLNYDNSEEINVYQEQCDLLKMISIPSFGIYEKVMPF